MFIEIPIIGMQCFDQYFSPLTSYVQTHSVMLLKEFLLLLRKGKMHSYLRIYFPYLSCNYSFDNKRLKKILVPAYTVTLRDAKNLSEWNYCV